MYRLSSGEHFKCNHKECGKTYFIENIDNCIDHMSNKHSIYYCKKLGKKLRKNLKKRKRKKEEKYDTDTDIEEEDLREVKKRKKEKKKSIKKPQNIQNRSFKPCFEETDLFVSKIRFDRMKKQRDNNREAYKIKKDKNNEILESNNREIKRLKDLYSKEKQSSANYFRKMGLLIQEIRKLGVSLSIEEQEKRKKEIEMQEKFEKKLENEVESYLNQLQHQKILVDQWKANYLYKKQQYDDLNDNKNHWNNLNSLLENLNTIIETMPHNSPLRKELLKKLSEGEVERQWFVDNVVKKGGLGNNYMKELVKVDEFKHLFLKKGIKEKRQRWKQETYDTFGDILDEIMPFRSGREFRIRRKNRQETYSEYVRIMDDKYPNVKYFGYTTFWRKIKQRGEKIRFVRRSSWCPLCVKIQRLEMVKNAELRGELDDLKEEEWYPGDNHLGSWKEEAELLKRDHIREVHHQFQYYQYLKKLIKETKDVNKIIIVQDFSKLEIEKGDTYQDQIFTIYYYDEENDNILSYKYVHYLASEKNDKYFFFKTWECLLQYHEIFEPFRSNSVVSNRNLEVFIFSDGARKHYKQQFSITWMAFLEKLYQRITFEWNFFLSNHGFNSCDAAGAQAKRRLLWFFETFPNRRLGSAVRAAACISYNAGSNLPPDHPWRGVKNHEAYSLAGVIYRPPSGNNPTLLVNYDRISEKHCFRYCIIDNQIEIKSYRLSMIPGCDQLQENSNLSFELKQRVLIPIDGEDMNTMQGIWDEIIQVARESTMVLNDQGVFVSNEDESEEDDEDFVPEETVENVNGTHRRSERNREVSSGTGGRGRNTRGRGRGGGRRNRARTTRRSENQPDQDFIPEVVESTVENRTIRRNPRRSSRNR